MSARTAVCVVVALGALTASGARAAPQTPAVFSSKMESVRVDALVTDRQQPVLGLKSGDFKVTDNGVPQTVDLVEFEQIPLNVVLALDMSSSVEGEILDQLRAAGQAVLGNLEPGDKAGLLTFGSAVSLRMGLTTDFAKVRAALNVAATADDTALVDASYSAMALGRSDGRSLVIVFSDGSDTASFLRPEAVLGSAKRGDAVVYGVSSGSPGRTSFLQELCNITGGRALNLQSNRDLSATFVGILNEFRQRYVISYTPRGVPDKGWHSVEVRVATRGVTVKARSGYLVGQ
jgi:VWFA-related protein